MNNKTIAIIKTGALGDVLRTSYFAETIKKKFPTCRIIWICSNSSYDILRYNPYIDKILLVEKIFQNKVIIECDILFSLEDDISKELFKFVSYKKIVGVLYENNCIKYSSDSALWFDMGLISSFGKDKADLLKKNNKKTHGQIFSRIFDVNYSDLTPSFYAPNLISLYRSIINKNKFNIAINPFAGSRWPSKELKHCELIQLIPMLKKFKFTNMREIEIFFFDDGTNSNILKYIQSNFPYINIINTKSSIFHLNAAIKALDYIITTDSLILHLSIANRIKNLSFYTSTSSIEIDTFGTGCKLKSTSSDYCSYRKDASNETITAQRIMSLFIRHIS